MVVLGLVLIVVVVLLGTAVAVSNPAVLDLNLFGAHVPVTLGGVFFTGAGAMVVALLGLLLVQRGIVRARRRRKIQKLSNQAAAAPAPKTAAPAARSMTAPPIPAEPRSNRAAEGSSSTTADERAAMLADADRLTSDDPR